MESLTRSRDLSQDAYKAGSITLTDVLDADRQLLTAQDQLASNRADTSRAAVEFSLVRGRLAIAKPALISR